MCCEDEKAKKEKEQAGLPYTGPVPKSNPLPGCVPCSDFWKSFGGTPTAKITLFCLQALALLLSLICDIGLGARFNGQLCGGVRLQPGDTNWQDAIWNCYDNWDDSFTVGMYAFGGGDITFTADVEGAGKDCTVTFHDYNPAWQHTGRLGAAAIQGVLIGNLAAVVVDWFVKDYRWNMAYYGAAGAWWVALISLTYFQPLYQFLDISNSCAPHLGRFEFDTVFYPAPTYGWIAMAINVFVLEVNYWVVWGIKAHNTQAELDATYGAVVQSV